MESVGEPTCAFACKADHQMNANNIERIAFSMPMAGFTASPLWREARWCATTFRWHATGTAPPKMGLVFEHAEAGKELFRELEKAYNHVDRFEELRISIIEGSPPGQQSGYTVHFCPDPDALAMHATGEDIVLHPQLATRLGRWNRMYPIPGALPLLPRFKEEFRKHGEFLLVPLTRGADGQNYFNSELGLIKHSIEFRNLAEIGKDDIDARALAMPQLIPPRTSASMPDANSIE
jgi:hypothetical protein